MRGQTLDYLVDRQAWAWLYGVNVYIAIQGDWSFSYLEHLWSLCVEEHFYLVWPLVVFLLARRPRTLIAVSLAIALGAMLARLTGSLHGAELVDHLCPDAVPPGRPGARRLPCGDGAPARWAGAAGAGPAPRRGRERCICSSATFVWTRLVSRDGLELVLPVRAALIQMLLACLLVWALVAPQRSATSRFFRSRWLMFLGTYSYGLYVYHHFISYYLTTNRTELELAQLARLSRRGGRAAGHARRGGLAGHCLRELRIFREAVSQSEAIFRDAERPASAPPTAVRPGCRRMPCSRCS